MKSPLLRFGLDQGTVEMFQAIALADGHARLSALGAMWGDRDICAGARGIRTPMLTIAAGRDARRSRPAR